MADIKTMTLPNGITYNLKDARITGLGQISVSLTANGWSSKSQSVTATGVTANSILVVSPAPASFSEYVASGVRATAQTSNSITFACNEVPVTALSVNVMYINLA